MRGDGRLRIVKKGVEYCIARLFKFIRVEFLL